MWKRKLLLVQRGSGKSKEQINEVLAQEQQALEKLNRLHQYWYLTINMFDILGPAADPQKVKSYQWLLDDGRQADTFQTKVLYYFLQQNRHYMQHDYETAHRYARQLIHFIEGFLERIREDPNTYATALNNCIGLCLQTQKMEEVIELIQKIKQMPTQYRLSHQQPFTVKMLAQTYNIELEFYRDTRQYEKSNPTIQQMKTFLSENARYVPDSYQLLLHYQVAYLYFVQKQYSQALKWLNEMIGHNYGRVREDIQSYGRILNLMIHFELGNILVLKYAVESTRRFLKKKRNLQPFEKKILHFFAKVSTAPLGEYPLLLQQLQSTLFAGMDEKDVANILDYLDFNSWIQGKLRKK